MAEPQRYVRWLYFAPDRQICVGRGTPVRTLFDCASLPWTVPGGAMATIEQIQTAWNTVISLLNDAKLLSVNDMRARTNIRLEQY